MAELLREKLSQLPASADSEALQAERDGLNAMRSKDYASAITNLKHSTSVDPHLFPRMDCTGVDVCQDKGI